MKFELLNAEYSNVDIMMRRYGDCFNNTVIEQKVLANKDGKITRVKEVVVVDTDLNEILEVSEKIGMELIISNNNPYPWIEIYDNYLE